MKNANLQWREQRIYPDATRCKTGCCRTGTKQHCFQKWKCDCHKTEVTK